MRKLDFARDGQRFEKLVAGMQLVGLFGVLSSRQCGSGTVLAALAKPRRSQRSSSELSDQGQMQLFPPAFESLDLCSCPEALEVVQYLVQY